MRTNWESGQRGRLRTAGGDSEEKIRFWGWELGVGGDGRLEKLGESKFSVESGFFGTTAYVSNLSQSLS